MKASGGLRTECGSGVHVVQGSFWRRLGHASIVGSRCRLPPVGALCDSTCVTFQKATNRRVEGDVVRFLCVHLAVVSEREIFAVVL